MTGAAGQITLDQAFVQVMQACAAPRRDRTAPGSPATSSTAITRLHQAGHAHSSKSGSMANWSAALYGVSIGRMFFGESMFARVSDASKCAYAALVRLLRRLGFA